MKTQHVKLGELTHEQANSAQIMALNAILSGMLYELNDEQLARVSGKVRHMVAAFDELQKSDGHIFWAEMRNTTILTINTAIPGCIDLNK